VTVTEEEKKLDATQGAVEASRDGWYRNKKEIGKVAVDAPAGSLSRLS
jgi:hypothetical protein